MLSANMSEVMVELVDYDVGIVEEFLTGDVDRLVPMDIASECFLLSAWKSHLQSRSLYSVVFAEKIESFFGTLSDRDKLYDSLLEGNVS